jgi:hypothetical protein
MRIRHGIYALPDLPADILCAVTVGGRLGRASALAHYGLGDATPLLHVTVERGAKWLRSPYDAKTPLDPSRDGVVVHWTRRRLDGTRLVVSAAEAQPQAARCKALTR